MKKKLCVLLALVLAFSLCPGAPALAEEPEGDQRHIIDEAGILTEEQIRALEDMAARYSEAAQVGIYVITEYDYTQNCPGWVTDAAFLCYEGYWLGYGPGRDGILLYLSMKDRDYALIYYGDRASGCFDDEKLDQIEDAFLDNFRENDWEGGMADYIHETAEVLQATGDVAAVGADPTVEPAMTGMAVFPLLILLALMFLL